MIAFLKSSASFLRLEVKALKYYPSNFVLAVLQSFVETGIWFFVSLFLNDYAGPSLNEYGGDFVAYMVIGVIFFSNANKIMNSPFQSLSAAFWDKRLEVYNSASFGIWAFIMGRVMWSFIFNMIIQMSVLAVGIFALKLNISSNIKIIPALIFYFLFLLISFGIGLIGASMFFTLEVKQGREPVTWFMNVIARIFSGVYYPIAVLPAAILFVSKLLPHTYALQGIRLIMINGYGFANGTVKHNFIILLLFCITTVTIGIISLNRALQKAERNNGVGMVV